MRRGRIWGPLGHLQCYNCLLSLLCSSTLAARGSLLSSNEISPSKDLLPPLESKSLQWPINRSTDNKSYSSDWELLRVKWGTIHRYGGILSLSWDCPKLDMPSPCRSPHSFLNHMSSHVAPIVPLPLASSHIGGP